ncbi:polysaccharide deacetylase family protein [Pseudofrankia sp. BMG5.36]|uniref:polysaccharide deacetylase family protein n=1 Tax=Pseudofrankia sp. BMG5.36 TaxID=1834512 RepID=UPI0008D9245E|nr:polysaccharide deacetylase family protein [Pseudofrankia sp. BMG5.36]OHV54287.1 polysaccharide deacetylase [Pseudofrankia sp. BMG5.36]
MTRRRRAVAWYAPVCLVVALAACGGEAPAQPAPGPTAGTATASAAGADGAGGAGSASPSLGTSAFGPSAGQTNRPTTPPAASAVPRPSSIGPPPPTPGTGLPAGLFGKDWERIPTDRKIVALTFDAGANADGVTPILATLAREHVAGTFFLTGQFATSFPAKVRDIAASGGRMGNHSSTHPYFTKIDDAALRGEVLGAERDILAVGGKDPRPFFRFPFGDRNAHDIAAVNALGYVPIRWTVDTLGWQGTSGGRTAASGTARVLDALQPGEIVLMHLGSHPQDHSTLDADALPGIISALRDRGYGFVTLDALVG